MLQANTCVLITLQKSNVFYACLGVKLLARCFSLFCSLLVVFYFLPVGRYCLLVARYFFIVAGCFPLVACYFLIVACYYLLVTRYFLLVTLLVTFWSPFALSARRSLLLACCLLLSFFLLAACYFFSLHIFLCLYLCSQKIVLLSKILDHALEIFNYDVF